MVVMLGMGQGRGQRDESEGQMEGKGWEPCQVWSSWDKSCGGKNWGQGMCKTNTNRIVNSNFADVCAFEDVITKNINHCTTCTNWLVGS